VTSPYEEPWAWGRQDGVDAARLSVPDVIPDSAVVRAAPKVLPLLTERVGLFELELPTEPRLERAAPALAEEAAVGVNWVVFDGSELVAPVGRWSDLEVFQFCSEFEKNGWVPVVRDAGVVVFTFADDAARLGLDIAFADEDQSSVCVAS